jgi:hypothetical protein
MEVWMQDASDILTVVRREALGFLDTEIVH